ncbi:MAG: hypothetical protein ACOC9S_04905 [Planctomycetota bacterium]
MNLALAPAILLAFYLYLVVRWQHVKRPFFFCLGVVGVIAMLFFTGFFDWTGARWSRVLESIVGTLAAIMAFGCAMAACWGESLPMGLEKKKASQPQAPSTPPASQTPQSPSGGQTPSQT